jgi:hypothetical protein
VSSADATRLSLAAPAEPSWVPVVTRYGRVRNSSRVRRRSGLFCGSTAGKRRPDPHGQGSLRPSFSTSSVSMPTTRSPRLTLDSLEGTPVGACWSAQKDASASRSRYMAVLPCPATRRQNRSEHGRRVPADIQAAAPHRAGISPARPAAVEDVHPQCGRELCALARVNMSGTENRAGRPATTFPVVWSPAHPPAAQGSCKRPAGACLR